MEDHISRGESYIGDCIGSDYSSQSIGSWTLDWIETLFVELSRVHIYFDCYYYTVFYLSYSCISGIKIDLHIIASFKIIYIFEKLI